MQPSRSRPDAAWTAQDGLVLSRTVQRGTYYRPILTFEHQRFPASAMVDQVAARGRWSARRAGSHAHGEVEFRVPTFAASDFRVEIIPDASSYGRPN